MNNNIEEKNRYEECREIQDRLFEQWKEFMDEYSNAKNLEITGENCKEAWMRCMKMQHQLFIMWQELITEVEACDIKSLGWRKKNCPFWKSWLRMQKEFLKKWEYMMKMEEMAPEKPIENFYQIWFEMMNESFKILWEEQQNKRFKKKTILSK